jgi:hypothetical protein
MNDHVIERSMLRWLLVGVALLALVLGMAGTAAVRSAGSADAQPTQLAAVGPVGEFEIEGEDFEFPEWYQDDDGTRLVPCLDEVIECHQDEEEEENGDEEEEEEGFEFFYFAAEAVFPEEFDEIDFRRAEFAVVGTLAHQGNEPPERPAATGET